MVKKTSLILYLRVCIYIFVFLLAAAKASFAATYYVAVNGDNAVGDGSSSKPFASISRALPVMNGGDTLIVKDGVYADRAGMIVNDHYSPVIPNGTSSAFTTIKAETPYGVRLKWTGGLNYYDAPVMIERAQYVHIDGFVYEMLNMESPSYVVQIGSSYNKVTRTIVKRSTVDAWGGWYAVGGSDNLIEDAAGVGAARYGFYAGGPDSNSQRNIFRRCVGRMDFANTTQPKATFAIYGNNATADVRDYLLQNVIAIDGQRPSANGEEKYGGFYNPKNASNVYYQGAIVLNEAVGHAGMFAQEWGSGINLKDTVIWDLPNSLSSAVGLRANDGSRIVADHMTIGGVIPGGYFSSGTSATNSLLGGNPNNILNNPSGAVILNRAGVSGTFWGQTGYDQITSEPLWPWPYEDKIREVFRETNDPPANFSPTVNNATRGFCADGQTLTKYIWEYLGNPTPPEIYGGDTTAPATVTNLAATTGINPGEINLTWTSPGDDGNTGTAAGYIIKYAPLAIITEADFNAATDVTAEPLPLVAGTNQSMTITGLTAGQIYYFAIKAQDEVPNISGLSNSPSAVAQVGNTAPVLALIGNKTVTEGASLSFAVSATDADGDALTYSASGLPLGAAFDAVTKTFSWIPGYTQAGSYSVDFSVSDGKGGVDAETIIITVTDVTQTVSVIVGNSSGYPGNLNKEILVSVSDVTGLGVISMDLALDYNSTELTFVSASTAGTIASNWPAPVYNSSTPGKLLIAIYGTTPLLGQGDLLKLYFNVNPTALVGTSNLILSKVKINDGTGITSTVQNGTFAVLANQAPMLALVGNKTVNEGELLNIVLAATDADNYPLPLVYSASGLPQGATFNAATATFSWTPDYTQAGSYLAVHFEVTDGELKDWEDITITVVNSNIAPVLALIGDKTVVEGVSLSFAISATDADGDLLTYSASGLPLGAAFDAVTKTFSWTPDYTQAGIYNVSFSVSDGRGGSDSKTTTITVANTNRAPVLDVIGAKTIILGSTLTFSISATDADNDSLTYSASNLPQGASFDVTTKTFSWTPGSGKAGSYTVTFTVTDSYGDFDNESIIITVSMAYGDVNGDTEVSAYDAALAAQYAVGLITLTQEQIKAANVTTDIEVSAYDAALIAQKAVGLISKFPREG